MYQTYLPYLYVKGEASFQPVANVYRHHLGHPWHWKIPRQPTVFLQLKQLINTQLKNTYFKYYIKLCGIKAIHKIRRNKKNQMF